MTNRLTAIGSAMIQTPTTKSDEQIADEALVGAGYMPEAHYVQKWGRK